MTTEERRAELLRKVKKIDNRINFREKRIKDDEAALTRLLAERDSLAQEYVRLGDADEG